MFRAAETLFQLRPLVTLSDLSNTYFEGAATRQPKAKCGHWKERHSDAPLLTLGLVIDSSGFVRRSEVFAGNVVAARTLATMLIALAVPTGGIVVMDRAIATDENRTWLRAQGYIFLVVSRGQTRFETKLPALRANLSKPRTRKNLAYVQRKIGQLQSQNASVAPHDTITVTPDPTHQKAIDLSWELHPQAGAMMDKPGVYSLRSNCPYWDATEMGRTYVLLTEIEAVFRSLKSELGLRPIDHHKEHRADGHLLISVIAYQAIQVRRTRMAQTGVTASWTTIRNSLQTVSRITTTFDRPDGRSLHRRKTALPNADQTAIYNAMQITPPSGHAKNPENRSL